MSNKNGSRDIRHIISRTHDYSLAFCFKQKNKRNTEPKNIKERNKKKTTTKKKKKNTKLKIQIMKFRNVYFSHGTWIIFVRWASAIWFVRQGYK